jgi:hypothetical protein
VRRKHSLTASATVIAAALAGCASVPTAAPPAVPDRAVITAAPGSLDGVYEAGVPGSYSGITSFASVTGTTPNVALYYSGWWEKFQAAFAATAWSHGTYTFVQLQPAVPLETIVRGWSDAYLRSYAAAVKAFGHPVILSFAHEMNGGWYPWGAGHVKPAVFIAAWRHVVQVFRAEGATNVTWVWTVNAVNAVNAAGSPPSQWWPGSAWVNWVGVDGYYYRAADTFQSVFGGTISEIREFTSAPVLLSETAVGPSPRAAGQVTGLFAGIRTDHLLGLVWFDQAQDQPPYHLDWHLADDPQALAAFRAAAKAGT